MMKTIWDIFIFSVWLLEFALENKVGSESESKVGEERGVSNFKYFHEKGQGRKVSCVCLIGSGKT